MKITGLLGVRILLVLGLATSIFGVAVLKRAASCGEWPETEGEIIGAYIRSLPAPEAKTQNHLTPDIIYEYRAPDGKLYFSNRISHVGADAFLRISENYYAGNYDNLKEFLSKYPVGKKLKVYYNPEKPSEAVLDNALKAPAFLPLILGLLLLCLAFHFHVFGRFGRAKKSSAT